MKNIFLWGMPGAGKSTLGKKLAASLQIPFKDLDIEIEKSINLKIPQIIQQYGEIFFRELEQKTLISIVKSENNFILSCGGGTPCFYENEKLMNQNGITIFLNTNIDTLLKRLENNVNRPLLNKTPTKEELQQLFIKREKFYSKAQLQIDEPNQNVNSILELLKLDSNH